MQVIERTHTYLLNRIQLEIAEIQRDPNKFFFLVADIETDQAKVLWEIEQYCSQSMKFVVPLPGNIKLFWFPDRSIPENIARMILQQVVLWFTRLYLIMPDIHLPKFLPNLKEQIAFQPDNRMFIFPL